MAGHIGQSGDRHADRKLTIRPSEPLRAAALEVLQSRGLTANDYVLACLAALVADPDRQIANVAEHWPQPKPKGRPRKNAAPDMLPPLDDPERLPPRPRSVEQSGDDAPHLYLDRGVPQPGLGGNARVPHGDLPQ